MDAGHDNTAADSISSTGWSRAILHVDMDAFFVNVHLLDHPEDVGAPLVTGGRPDQRGVVSSASYEARRFGVRSAMPTGQALRLCPQLKIVSANWTRIRECSLSVMSILEKFGPVEQMSVDEAYIDLSASPDPEATTAVIRKKVKETTQLPCSVGLAGNKLVAKVASDYEKPEGFTTVRPGEEAAFLAPLPPRVLWGIGPRTAEKLLELEIRTCGQLAAADPDRLRRRFGRQGHDLQRRARGEDDRPVHSERGRAKSISQEWTFSRDVKDPEVLRAQIYQMAARVAASLHKRKLVAHTVRVKFRWADFTTFTRQKSMEMGTDDADLISRLALLIWEENWPLGQHMRLIGVGVTNLEERQGKQLKFDF